jgi:hypothetical protein
MLSFDWNKIDAVRRDRIANAEAEMEKLNSGPGFYAWLRIGEGLTEWRDAACELSGSQDLNSDAYRAAFRAGAPNYPRLAKLPQSERSQAIWMWENKAYLEGWHANLSDKERRNWNHPRTVWRHAPIGQAMKQKSEPAQAKLGQAQKGRTVLDQIEQAATVLGQATETHEAKRAQDMMFDLSGPGMIHDSAQTCIEVYGRAPAAAFARAILAILDDVPAVDFAAAAKVNEAWTEAAVQMAAPGKVPPRRPRGIRKVTMKVAQELLAERAAAHIDPGLTQSDLDAAEEDSEALADKIAGQRMLSEASPEFREKMGLPRDPEFLFVKDHGKDHRVDTVAGEAWVIIPASRTRGEHLRKISNRARIKRLLRLAKQ